MRRANLRQAVPLIEGRVEFTNSTKSLRGVTRSEGTGRLPEKWAEEFGTPEYIVYSYATPIAWYGNGEWTIPDTRYSTTTSRHQHTVRMAVA